MENCQVTFIMDGITTIELPEEAPSLALERSREGLEKVVTDLVDYIRRRCKKVCISKSTMDT